MASWILKTEPSTYSFAQLQNDGTTFWDGVRNYQARNNLRAMKLGDTAYIYHSIEGKALVGIAQVSGTARPDPSASEGDWVGVDLIPIRPLKRAISLQELKDHPVLCALPIVRQGRLSVSPIPESYIDILKDMETI